MRVAKTRGWSASAAGTPLASSPASPARVSAKASPPYTCEQAGQRDALRFRQGRRTTPVGSWSLPYRSMISPVSRSIVSRSPTRAMGEEQSFVRLSCSRTARASVPYRADRALRDEGSEPGASISAPSARLRDRSGTTQRRRPGLVGREGGVEGGSPEETGRYRSRRRQIHSLSHSLSIQMGLVSDAGRAFVL